ncbi:MAG: cysteine desulfurase family protein [Candidatus Poribacteria bacterium]|nr:cysteine desulfurase family protein [Candidatus Poribacteria bacterium]
MSPIYFDYQATTPLDPNVRSAMEPYWNEHFGNPHMVDHRYGTEAAQAIRYARSEVANLINADDEEIVFTSGATESCNLALRGVVANNKNKKRNRIITVVTEHPAVFETVKQLSNNDLETIILPVDVTGHLDLEKLEAVLDEQTLLVSVMVANNEIGTLHPIAKIAKRCRDVGAFFHTDASQAVGRISIDVEALGVDLLSFSAHKMYGPKGVGALFIRTGVKLVPLFSGGEQEQGIRAGTLPTPNIVGFGAACNISLQNMEEDRHRIEYLTSWLFDDLKEVFPNLYLFGDSTHRLPGNLNIGFPGVSSEQVVSYLFDKIAVASGSACSSEKNEPSRVLLALGLDPETASTALRLSLGRFSTESEVNKALTIFKDMKVGI